MQSDGSPSSVLSHWYSSIENFQTSPKDFYSSVEAAVRKREIPDCEVSRVDWKEGGAFSASREYLRVQRGRHVFDICAAPFGKGFFVSWWLSRTPSQFGALALFLVIAGLFLTMIVLFGALGFFRGLVLFVLGAPLLFWLFVKFVAHANEGWDDALVAMPFFGPIYERIFSPQTYYKTDTALMFQESVRAAVREAIDGVTSTQGRRGLTDLEFKPILRGL